MSDVKGSGAGGHGRPVWVTGCRDDLLYDSLLGFFSRCLSSLHLSSVDFSFPMFFYLHATLHFEGESHKYWNYFEGYITQIASCFCPDYLCIDFFSSTKCLLLDILAAAIPSDKTSSLISIKNTGLKQRANEGREKWADLFNPSEKCIIFRVIPYVSCL